MSGKKIRISYTMPLKKEDAHKACLQVILDRIRLAEKAMLDAQEASHSETKGSAGDKHETGRALMQHEQDKHAGMVEEARHSKWLLDSMKPGTAHQTIQLGSLVYTGEDCFYISLGLGKLQAGAVEFFAIAPASPVGTLFMGKKKGDRITFREKQFLIREVL